MSTKKYGVPCICHTWTSRTARAAANTASISHGPARRSGSGTSVRLSQREGARRATYSPYPPYSASEGELSADLEEPALQHVGRTEPRGRRRRRRVRRAHRERPAAVEHVVDVEVHAQAVAAEPHALRCPQIELVQVVIAVLETLANQLNGPRRGAGPVASDLRIGHRAQYRPVRLDARTGAAGLHATAELIRTGELDVERQRIRPRELHIRP